MPLVDFAELPDDARLWVFPASRPLSAAESERLLSAVDEFLATWAAHGSPLQTSREWRLGQFLLVAVDEAATGVSGCSVDALVRCLRRVEHDLDIRMTDHGPVFFRDREESAAVGPTRLCLTIPYRMWALCAQDAGRSQHRSRGTGRRSLGNKRSVHHPHCLSPLLTVLHRPSPGPNRRETPLCVVT
jgi:hypothetical protein